MTEILCAVKGGASPKGKPRVWFTCHPADFEKYFEKICGDLFAAHDCAVYYTADMSCAIAEQNRQTDLGSNNLFVIPVTLKLLIEPNRAMDLDVPYALSNHIPVLPVMMEPGLDLIYSRPDKFGQLQYLNPFSTDATEISYAEKLKKYLISTLTDEETIRRVRSAFDAYVFLSYRKKDRRHANELMRLIHSHPECRDLAIWYDEFLTPGESFQENITRVLTDSKLFLLLVTPNLLEEPEGKPNFVMGEEYPAARKSGIGILPAQMEQTDPGLLQSKFEGLPPCVSVEDGDAFRQRLLTAVETLSDPGNDGDPEHLYLMGVAYLNGIDVETDRTRGLELITQAAEADLPEAMYDLYERHMSGQGVAVDYCKAQYWANRLADCFENSLGEDHQQTINAWGNLAIVYGKLGKHAEAMELQEKVYALQCKVQGDRHPYALRALGNLAFSCGALGDYKKTCRLQEHIYSCFCEIQGEESPDALHTLGNLAETYSQMGNYKKALRLQEKIYACYLQRNGREHETTLLAMNNLAYSYSADGDHIKALELMEQVYIVRCEVLGETHPDTLSALNGMAYINGALRKYNEALELLKKAYVVACDTLGEKSPESLAILNNLAQTNNSLEKRRVALELQEKLCGLCRDVLGEEHPNSLTALNNLSCILADLGDYKRAAEFAEKAYRLRKKLLGEKHPDTIMSLHNLASVYGQSGRREKALVMHEKAYTLSAVVMGENHLDTLSALESLALLNGVMRNHKKALKLLEKYYGLCTEVWGENNEKTVAALKNLAFAYSNTGQKKKALELLGRAERVCYEKYGPLHPMTREVLRAIRQVCGF